MWFGRAAVAAVRTQQVLLLLIETGVYVHTLIHIIQPAPKASPAGAFLSVKRADHQLTRVTAERLQNAGYILCCITPVRSRTTDEQMARGPLLARFHVWHAS